MADKSLALGELLNRFGGDTPILLASQCAYVA